MTVSVEAKEKGGIGMTKVGSTLRGAEIRSVNPLGIGDWDALVLACPKATIFHSRAWAEVLYTTYGHEPNYLAMSDDSRLDALLPLMEVRSFLTGRKGISLPFADLCPPLGDEEQFKMLFGRATELANERGWRYLELRGLHASSADGASLTFLGHTLGLSASEEALFAGFDGSVRRAIRKAEQSGLKISTGTGIEDIRVYYELHGRTRQRHGVPPQPWRFFENLQRYALQSGHGFVVTGRHGSQPIAAAVFLHFGRNATFKFGASDFRYQELRGNNLVMWHGIQQCRKLGFSQLHFGRTSATNEGLRRYKLGFGTTEEVVNYLRLDPRTLVHLAMTDASEGWMNTLFGYVPRWAARWIGRALYPHAS